MTNGPAIIEALDKSSDSPSELAFDRHARTLFSACDNDLMAVVDGGFRQSDRDAQPAM